MISSRLSIFIKHWAFACTLAVALTSIANASSGAIKVGENAPKFQLTTLEGHTVSLSELKDHKPVYLKFWATWCVACLKEMPHFTQSYQRFGNHIEFVAVNVAINDTLERIAATRAKFNLEVPVYYDESGELQTKYDFMGTPTHVVIDVGGKIVHLGFSADETLDKALQKVYEEVAK